MHEFGGTHHAALSGHCSKGACRSEQQLRFSMLPVWVFQREAGRIICSVMHTPFCRFPPLQTRKFQSCPPPHATLSPSSTLSIPIGG